MEKSKTFVFAFAALLLLVAGLSFSSLNLLESFRIVFGSLFVLFLPGYVITELFLNDRDIIEKIALSFALSIAIVPLTIFYLNKLGMRITTITSILTIFLIILIAFLIKNRGKIYKSLSFG